MQMIPEEVETAFLNRTIKAFTWVRIDDDVKKHWQFRMLCYSLIYIDNRVCLRIDGQQFGRGEESL